MDTDAALAGRLARDLDAAYPALVAAHQDRLYTIALRLLGDGRDAEEVAQDALARAYRAMAGYPADRTAALQLRPWLAAIAVNLARNRRRRIEDRRPPASLEPMLDAGFDPPIEARALPAAAAERRETQLELAGALLELSPTVRAVIVLRHVDGLSTSETALAVGRPEGTVKSQVQRGLAQLRAILERTGAGPTSSSISISTEPAAPPTESLTNRRGGRLSPALEAIR